MDGLVKVPPADSGIHRDRVCGTLYHAAVLVGQLGTSWGLAVEDCYRVANLGRGFSEQFWPSFWHPWKVEKSEAGAWFTPFCQFWDFSHWMPESAVYTVRNREWSHLPRTREKYGYLPMKNFKVAKFTVLNFQTRVEGGFVQRWPTFTPNFQKEQKSVKNCKFGKFLSAEKTGSLVVGLLDPLFCALTRVWRFGKFGLFGSFGRFGKFGLFGSFGKTVSDRKGP